MNILQIVYVFSILLIIFVHGDDTSNSDLNIFDNLSDLLLSEEKINNRQKSLSLNSLGCFEDVDCDRGLICSKTTMVCEPVDDCPFTFGRKDGHKHQECILCKDDSECGWQPNIPSLDDGNEMISKRLDYCWPDGQCREYPPFSVNIFKIETNDTLDQENSDISVISTNKFSKGERACVTVSPWFKEESPFMKIDITSIQLCVSKQYFNGKILSYNTTAKHLYQRKPDIHYPGIIHYDATNPHNTGCQTHEGNIRSYIVYSSNELRTGKKGRTDWLRVSQDANHFHPSSKFTSITKGKDTVCFDVMPMTNPNIPIYMQTEISVHRVLLDKPRNNNNNNSEFHQERELDHQEILNSMYGVSNSSKSLVWKGVVASPKFRSKWKEESAMESSQNTVKKNYEEYNNNNDDDDDGGLFVDCGRGTKFNGVAGLCESPSISNQLYFWTLLGSTLILIAGTIIFVIQINTHNKNILHLINTGHIDA